MDCRRLGRLGWVGLLLAAGVSAEEAPPREPGSGRAPVVAADEPRAPSPLDGTPVVFAVASRHGRLTEPGGARWAPAPSAPRPGYRYFEPLLPTGVSGFDDPGYWQAMWRRYPGQVFINGQPADEWWRERHGCCCCRR